MLYLNIANSHQYLLEQAVAHIRYWLKICQQLLLSICVYTFQIIRMTVKSVLRGWSQKNLQPS